MHILTNLYLQIANIAIFNKLKIITTAAIYFFKSLIYKIIRKSIFYLIQNKVKNILILMGNIRVFLNTYFNYIIKYLNYLKSK